MSRPDYLSPIIMQDSVAFADDVSTRQPRTIRMLNPNRTAMLVDELRFYTSERQGQEINFDLDDFFVNLKLGSIPLTDDYVPLYGMALNYNLQPSSQMWVDDWFGSSLEVGYTYRLPKPLYVPPDVPLEIILSKVRYAAGGAHNFNAIVVVAGRSMPENFPKPDFIYVPWTTSFAVDPNYSPGGVFDPLDEPMEATSTTNRLGNPHGENLVVTKLTGPYITERNPDGTNPNFFPDRALTIQATLSNGKIVIRDKVPYFDVFPLQKPWIDYNAVMTPKTFMRVQLEADPNFWLTPTSLYSELGNNIRLRPIRICVQGYRKLDRPWGSMP